MSESQAEERVEPGSSPGARGKGSRGGTDYYIYFFKNQTQHRTALLKLFGLTKRNLQSDFHKDPVLNR